MRKSRERFPLRPSINFFFALPRFGTGGMMASVGIVIVVTLVGMTILAPLLAPHNPTQLNVGPIAVPPSWQFPLGTNHLGEDILSRVIYGGAIMMQVAVLSLLICLVVGVPLGLFSGYRGRILDSLISLGMDSLYAFPGLILAIAIASVLGQGILNLAIAIAVVYIPSYFRVVRSQVLSIKEQPFIEAVKVSGGGRMNILFRQILPNVIPSIAVIASINIADAVLTEAGLTYLGLGPNVASPDWGWDIYYGKNLLLSGAWWAWIFPGLMIILLAVGFTFIGEGLSEVLNPKLGRR